MRSIFESVLQSTSDDDRDRAKRILRVLREYTTRFMCIVDPTEADEIAEDPMAHTVKDLQNVSNELIRKASPEKAAELEKLFLGFAKKVAKKVIAELADAGAGS